MTTFNLTCEAVGATLSDYLDGTLEGWVRSSIEEHLAECARCTGLARDLRNNAREAAALPALLPERDPWPRIASRIGVPVAVSEPVAESAPAPFTPTAEPIVLASEAAPPTTEPMVLVSETAPPAFEPPGLTTEPAALSPEPPVLTPEQPPVLTSVPPPPTAEQSLPAGQQVALVSEPLLPKTSAPLHKTAPKAVFSGSRKKKRWEPRWNGLAKAAALVLVTAGTTFLLTRVWLGPPRTTNVVSDTGTRSSSSSQRSPAEPGSRLPSAGRQQVASDSIPTLPSGQLGSALTVSALSAAEVTPSPEEVVYDKEINKLQRIVRRQKAGLDTSTVSVIEKNLRTLDSAISQIRAALKKDPGSSLLDGQASRALEMKVELLRRTAMLRSST